MPFGHLGDRSFHSAEQVRKRDTTHEGLLVYKKAHKIDMSTRRFDTDYPLSAVMQSWRGDKNEIHGQVGDLNSRDYTPQESTKKDNSTNSPMHTGGYGAAIGGSENAEKSWDL